MRVLANSAPILDVEVEGDGMRRFTSLLAYILTLKALATRILEMARLYPHCSVVGVDLVPLSNTLG